MRPHTAFENANNRAHDRRARKRPEEVTFRSFFGAALARLQSLFATRHATDSSLDDALGEQVMLPDAYPRPTAQDNKARKTQAEHMRFTRSPDLGKRK
jgi:hypothetical protein